jgi:hypothetical protein
MLSQVPKAAATIAPARATTPTIALKLIDSLTPPLDAVAAGASMINERIFEGCYLKKLRWQILHHLLLFRHWKT